MLHFIVSYQSLLYDSYQLRQQFSLVFDTVMQIQGNSSHSGREIQVPISSLHVTHTAASYRPQPYQPFNTPELQRLCLQEILSRKMSQASKKPEQKSRSPHPDKQRRGQGMEIQPKKGKPSIAELYQKYGTRLREQAASSLKSKIQSSYKNKPFDNVKDKYHKQFETLKAKAGNCLNPLVQNMGNRLQQQKKEYQRLIHSMSSGKVKIPEDIPQQDDSGRFVQQFRNTAQNARRCIYNIVQTQFSQFTSSLTRRQAWRNAEMKKVSRIKGNLISQNIEAKFSKFPGYDYGCNFEEKSHPKTTEWGTYYGLLINQQSMDGMFDKGWLSSAVMSNYCKFLTQTYNWSSPDNHAACIINESQVESMKNPQSYTQTCAGYSGIFTRYQRVGIIINKNNLHWFFIGVLPQKNVLIVYDSMFSTNSYTGYINNITSFMAWQRKKFNVNLSAPQTIIARQNAVYQQNGSDCGVCSLINLTIFLTRPEVSNPAITFDYEIVRRLRLGLYFFCIHLITAKRQNKFPLADLLYQSTIAIIMDTEWRELLDLQPDL